MTTRATHRSPQWRTPLLIAAACVVSSAFLGTGAAGEAGVQPVAAAATLLLGLSLVASVIAAQASSAWLLPLLAAVVAFANAFPVTSSGPLIATAAHRRVDASIAPGTPVVGISTKASAYAVPKRTLSDDPVVLIEHAGDRIAAWIEPSTARPMAIQLDAHHTSRSLTLRGDALIDRSTGSPAVGEPLPTTNTTLVGWLDLHPRSRVLIDYRASASTLDASNR